MLNGGFKSLYTVEHFIKSQFYLQVRKCKFSAGEGISITGGAKLILLTKYSLKSDTFHHFTKAENCN